MRSATVRALVALLLVTPPPAGAQAARSPEDAFRAAADNGARVEEIFRRTRRMMQAWLAHADERTLLLPDYLPGYTRGNRPLDLYTPHNSGADNYPYLVATAFFTDRAVYEGRMREMLRNEIRYTAAPDGIPGELELKTGKLGPPSLFGAAEYAKDGLLAVTELLGRTPWFYRMADLTAALMERAPVSSRFGALPDAGAELNGDVLQTLIRLAAMTADRRFLEWAERLGDAYVLEVLPGNHGLPGYTWDFGKHEGPDRMRLRDHGHEMVVGLALLHALESDRGAARAESYRPALARMLDRVLASANPDGMLYNEIRPSDLAPLDRRLAQDYVRLNEWPEWFTVDENALYRVVDDQGGETIRTGSDLKDGIEVTAPGRWTVGGDMHARVVAVVALFALARGAGAAETPFKLGTFERNGRTFPGLVLDDRWVVDVAAANADLERRHPDWRPLAMPSDMKELIERYEEGLRPRLHAIANEAGGDGGAAPRGAVHDVKTVRVRPPILYPETMLNAAVNYTEHEAEMQRRPQAAPSPTGAQSAPGLWERRPDDARQNPYLFLKPRTAVIADGEAIRIPPGRDRIDWECELAVVIGRRAEHVPVERAREHVFGYTLEDDVSDRGGRGDSRHGSDWLVGKAHDTFAPLGPFIVPKEFVPDPHRLGIRFALSGTLMQDSNTSRMTHTIDEMLHYASNILTLRPGDVISTGSPAGVGSARNPPIFMKPGDVAACTIEGIGTLTSPVAAAGPAGAASSGSPSAGPGTSREATGDAPERVIALVAFPELTLLDLVGPLQVLKSLPAPYRTVVVGEGRDPLPTDTGLTVTPERRFADVPRPFAVIVPGGPGSVAAMGSEAVQGYLRSTAPGAEVMGSVCTGALVLAATGLLEGRRATTHWAYAAELEKLGARYVRERSVEDGKFITAGGVSAGIDMAIALVARLTDRATAQRIQLAIEYDPHPPLGGIDWSGVGEAERERQREGGTGRRLKDAPRLLAGRPDLLRRLGIDPERR